MLLQRLIFPQKLSRRVAMVMCVGAVGRGLHQHRNLETGKPDRVHDAALFAEVRQREDDAVDLFRVLLEKLGAMLCFGVGFHRAVF